MSELSTYEKRLKALEKARATRKAKADAKPKKEPKAKKEPKPKPVKELKPYCGMNDPPKGYKRASMQECIDMKKVNYYGIKKVNPQVLATAQMPQDTEFKTKDDLIAKLAGLFGRLKRFQKQRNEFIDDEEKLKDITIQENDVKKEVKRLKDKYAKLLQ